MFYSNAFSKNRLHIQFYYTLWKINVVLHWNLKDSSVLKPCHESIQVWIWTSHWQHTHYCSNRSQQHCKQRQVPPHACFILRRHCSSFSLSLHYSRLDFFVTPFSVLLDSLFLFLLFVIDPCLLLSACALVPAAGSFLQPDGARSPWL